MEVTQTKYLIRVNKLTLPTNYSFEGIKRNNSVQRILLDKCVWYYAVGKWKPRI